MFKVSITNKKQNLLWEAKFESQELAQEWLEKQTGKPHRLPEMKVLDLDKEGNQQFDENEKVLLKTVPAEFTSEIIDISHEVLIEKEKSEARKLLSSTDWMVIRFIDSGVEIPKEIKDKREESRRLL